MLILNYTLKSVKMVTTKVVFCFVFINLTCFLSLQIFEYKRTGGFMIEVSCAFALDCHEDSFSI